MNGREGIFGRRGRFLFFSILVLLVLSGRGFTLPREDAGKKEEKRKGIERIVLPVVFYTPSTGLAAGAGGILYFYDLKDVPRDRPSSLSMTILYTMKSQFITEWTPDFYLGKGTYRLAGSFSYRKYVEKFYGIGPGASKDMEEEYRYRHFKLGLSLRRKVGRDVHLGFHVHWEHFSLTDVEPGGILDLSPVAGKSGGRLAGAGASCSFDTRDRLFYPTGGMYLQASLSWYFTRLGSDYGFKKGFLDFRQYFSPFPGHVVAFQERGEFSAGDLPFFSMPQLGGPVLLRGYIQGRYRDGQALLFQVEYRFPLKAWLGGVLFAGSGDVASSWSGFRVERFKTAAGAGLRFRISRKSGANVRLDFGVAWGSFGVYAMINEAF